MKFKLLEKARSDAGFAIYATAEVVEFIEGLDDEAAAKVVYLLEHTAWNGPPNNRQKSKKVVDEIYELKSFQVRIAYIYGGVRRTILLLHGFKKKTDVWPKNELKIAKRISAETQIATEKGTIEYDD